MQKTNQNKFLIDKLDIKIPEENTCAIRQKAIESFDKYYDNSPAINYTETLDIRNLIDPKYIIDDYEYDFLLFKEVAPHRDQSFDKYNFLTIMLYICGGPFYFGDTHSKQEHFLKVGDVFRVRTMELHWINTPHIEILSNHKNFCIALQYQIETKNFNKISQKILSKIKSN